MCTFRFLTDGDFSQVARTFDEAFSDYYVKMAKSSEHWLRNRAIKNGVAMDCTVAAFAGEKMVGFTLVGLDDWQGVSSAFDVATGIVPDYRGKGLARKMFEFCLPRLRERGVGQFLLEVLQVNKPAIGVYQKTGFEITREFDCYDLKRIDAVTPVESPAAGLILETISHEEACGLADQADWLPSWENSFAGIGRVPDDLVCIGARLDGELVGEVVYYPLINWILSLVVKREQRRRGIGYALIENLQTRLPKDWEQVKLTNVWCDDQATANLLRKCGFKPFASQFEMMMTL